MLHLSLVAVWLQSSGGDVRRGTWFLFVIAVALVMQAVGVCAAAMYAYKALKKFSSISDSFERKTIPLIEKSTALIDDLTPRIKAVTTNVEQISYTVREKVDELSATVAELNRTVTDVNFKTRVHVARVNGMVEDALDTTQEVQAVVSENIRKPVKQIAGIVAGVKAAVETLIARSPFKPKGYESPYDL
jgi:methyl-accepting chemotaxis protein